MQEQQTTKKKSKKSVIFWIAFASILAVGLYFLWQFLSGAYMSNGFYDGTTINGVDVSNLTSEQASNIIAAKLNEKRNEVEIELNYKDKSWKFEGKDFEVNPFSCIISCFAAEAKGPCGGWTNRGTKRGGYISKNFVDK